MANTILDKVAMPFDSTDAGDLALEQTASLLTAIDAKLHVVMVLDQYVHNELAEFAETERVPIDIAAERSCERLVVKADALGIDAAYRLIHDGDVVDRVVAEANRAECTAFLLPTHGMNRVTRWFVGNLRDRIVQSSHLPVLVLPPKA